jgi:acyl-CoA thioesterase
MHKVDMTAYNAGRPVHERRELMLYKLRKPLPADGTGGWDANAHVVAHAYVADRNGLLIVGNHVGFGYALGRAASLSYTFVMHVNAEQAVMKDDDGDGEAWWVQEMFFPRTAAGRGIVESKIWSPTGVHVATEYQDGLVQGLGVGKL